MNAGDLYKALKVAGVPVVGVSIGDEADRSTWTVELAPDADATQKTAAATLLQTFDPTSVVVVALPPVIDQRGTPAGLTPEQVLGWAANKLGVPYADALKEIANAL